MKISYIQAVKFIFFSAFTSTFLFLAFKPTGFSLFKIVLTLLIITAGSSLVFIFFKNRNNINYLGKAKYMYLALIIWCMFTIFRIDDFSLTNIQSLFGLNFLFWAWIVPFIAIFGTKIEIWLELSNLIKGCIFIGATVSVITIFFGGSLSASPWVLLIPFLYFSKLLVSKNERFMLIIISFLGLVISYLNGTRADTVYIIFALLLWVLNYLRLPNTNKLIKVVIYGIFCLLFVTIAFQIDTIINAAVSTDQLTTDTRTFLFVELLSDLNTVELMFGKGVMGTYFSEFFYRYVQAGLEGGDSPIRIIIEVAYLNMILKGGWLMVVLHLLVMVPAAYLGIMKSNNSIAQMCGYMVFVYLISFLITYPQHFSLNLLLLWLAIGTCLTRHCREKSDEDIMKYKGKSRIKFRWN